MDIDRRRVPDTYQCEVCNPRQLKYSKTQAREIQLKGLAREREEKEKKRRRRTKGDFKKKMFGKSVGFKHIHLKSGEGAVVHESMTEELIQVI